MHRTVMTIDRISSGSEIPSTAMWKWLLMTSIQRSLTWYWRRSDWP